MNAATQTGQRPDAGLLAIADVVAAQARYFRGNFTKPLEFRIGQLLKLKSMLQANEAALQAAIQADFGKQAFDTFLTEFHVIYDELEAALAGVREWARTRTVDANLLNARAKSYILPEPLGVSLVIGPWNYPYQLSLCPVMAAMAAGCTIILKPSELTVHSSSLLAQLIRANFPAEYFAVVEGGVPETTELLARKFDMIFFTGSVPVGRIVYQAAARHLTPVVLELGGKSPVIITPDVDLDEAMRRLVWAKFLNSGQTCIAPDYVLVHKSVEARLLERLEKELARVDYSLENGNYVRIVNERNVLRIVELIDPEKLLLGGGYDLQERWIQPTVLKGVEWTDRVMQDEIFGPLLPVLVYEDLDAAISEIKARPKPLALYLFTNDEATKQKVLSEVSFGGGCVNDALMHISNGNLPFGGVGDSGIGNYHGEAGFRAFSHYKSILEKDMVPDPDLKYSPHTSEKLAVLRQLTAG
ncbi:aldehyde dehydrogenase family protein [Paludibaculum fermentans]|uniref:aldehyde dehydrogenase family protein n=1 Tax=Paludibaculum fermentans TaxID=1473598 RepID=UPI003EBAA399